MARIRTAPVNDATRPTRGVAAEQAFTLNGLAEVRAVVGEHAAGLGLAPDRTADFVLAIDEIACNSVQHGGGDGVLRLWPEQGRLVCEIRDRGVIDDQHLERDRPGTDAVSGRGLWLAQQLCDELQITSTSSGTVVRAGIRLD